MSTLTGPNIRHLQVDVTEQGSIQAAIEVVYEQEGRVDILISNAGVHCTGPVLDITLEHAQKTYDTNVFGLMRLVKAFVPRMAERRTGLVVVIGSVRSELPTPFAGIYSS
ncbi:hypothetical protein MPER_08079, partial [Moniliophthora perniciosa FA553]